MKIQFMIYFYTLICVSLIIFNIFYSLTEHWKKGIFRFRDIAFEKLILKSWEEGTNEKICKKLKYKLNNQRYLIAFDKALNELRNIDSNKFIEYIKTLNDTIAHLFFSYRKKDELKVSFMCYLICEYPFFREEKFKYIVKKLLIIVSWDNIYCKVNAFKAICSLENVDDVVLAFKVLNKKPDKSNQRIIQETLLSFKGDKNKLCKELWELIEDLHPFYQTLVINYLRFSSADFKDEILNFVNTNDLEVDVLLAACRYFGKYKYEKAFPFILAMASLDERVFWEKKAVASTVLASYDCQETIDVLIKNLSCNNWFVRSNSADSLIRLGLTYFNLIDIMDGTDRYARESLQYKFDKKKIK